MTLMYKQKKEYRSKELVKTFTIKHDVDLEPKQLLGLIQNLQKVVQVLVEENEEMRSIVQKSGLEAITVNEIPDNVSLSKDRIKELILQEINIGQVFYPSDIAKKFGLDLSIVMDVIDKLKKENKLSET